MTAPAGWYPDPGGGGGSRWWNGVAWSDQAVPPPRPWTPSAPPAGGYATTWSPAAPTATAPVTGWRRHRFSILVVVFAALYVLLAITVHVAVLGVLPALLAARAVRAREPWAGGAVVVAIGSVVLAITGFAGLWHA